MTVPEVILPFILTVVTWKERNKDYNPPLERRKVVNYMTDLIRKSSVDTVKFLQEKVREQTTLKNSTTYNLKQFMKNTCIVVHQREIIIILNISN